MKYNAFKRGNQKPGGRIHRSTRASREELLAITPAGRGSKLERARRIQHLALMFMHRNGRWARLTNGPEVLKYEDDRLLIIFMIRNQIPPEIRVRFNLEPNDDGLYGLELWDKPLGKVLNLVWNTAGAAPRIVTYRRGDWEELFLPAPVPQ
jgi:hypothetical protein